MKRERWLTLFLGFWALLGFCLCLAVPGALIVWTMTRPDTPGRYAWLLVEVLASLGLLEVALVFLKALVALVREGRGDGTPNS